MSSDGVRIDRAASEEFEIAKFTARITLRTAVIAAIVSGVLTLAGTLVQGQQARGQYLLDQRRVAYSAFRSETQAISVSTRAAYLRLRTTNRVLPQTEILKEVTAQADFAERSSPRISTALSNVSVVGSAEAVDAAQNCTDDIAALTLDLGRIVDAYGRGADQGEAEYVRALTMEDQRTACDEFADVARTDLHI